MSNTARSGSLRQKGFAAAVVALAGSCLGAVAFSACGPSPAPRTATTAELKYQPRDEARAPDRAPPRKLSFEDKLLRAEHQAAPAGRAVLAAARKMIKAGVVVAGSCWGYANAVFNRAGFKNWRTRKRVFRGRKKGPYADPGLVKAGDWLYIINCPDILATHSVIFVFWVDRKRGEAAVITYVGNRREEPAFYRTYDVSRIYTITRPRFSKRPVKASSW
ncbi:MAG: hypothetical protein J7M25_16100 [Deltaproteobacteria bacterium]|nr:hypothetical protein [Deltaproteobacteria bacterium]